MLCLIIKYPKRLIREAYYQGRVLPNNIFALCFPSFRYNAITMKKIIITVISIIIVLAGGWYVFSSSENSQAAEIAQIASSTEARIARYTTSTQQNLRYELKNWQADNVNNGAETIEVFDLSFGSTWGEPESIDNRGSVAGISFGNNRSIIVSKPANATSRAEKYLKRIEGNISQSEIPPGKLFKQVLGKNYSSHDFMEYILSSDIDDVKNASTTQSAQARSYAITLRSTAARPGQPYKFSEGPKKGFVFESQRQTEVLMWANKKQFTITFNNGKGMSKVSREAVDATISSLRFANTSSSQDSNSENYFAD